MSLIDTLFSNKSLQSQLISKFRNLVSADAKGIFIDLTQKELSFDEITEESILISKKTHDFLIEFYNENKNK